MHSCEDTCTYSVSSNSSGRITTTCCFDDNCNAPNTTGIRQCYSTKSQVNNLMGEKITCLSTQSYCIVIFLEEFKKIKNIFQVTKNKIFKYFLEKRSRFFGNKFIREIMC